MPDEFDADELPTPVVMSEPEQVTQDRSPSDYYREYFTGHDPVDPEPEPEPEPTPAADAAKEMIERTQRDVMDELRKAARQSKP